METRLCPACGSKEKVYYCKNCDRYWCEDLGCPNSTNPFLRNAAGLFELADILVCTKCKRKGVKC